MSINWPIRSSQFDFRSSDRREVVFISQKDRFPFGFSTVSLHTNRIIFSTVRGKRKRKSNREKTNRATQWSKWKKEWRKTECTHVLDYDFSLYVASVSFCSEWIHIRSMKRRTVRTCSMTTARTGVLVLIMRQLRSSLYCFNTCMKRAMRRQHQLERRKINATAAKQLMSSQIYSLVRQLTTWHVWSRRLLLCPANAFQASLNLLDEPSIDYCFISFTSKIPFQHKATLITSFSSSAGAAEKNTFGRRIVPSESCLVWSRSRCEFFSQHEEPIIRDVLLVIRINVK